MGLKSFLCALLGRSTKTTSANPLTSQFQVGQDEQNEEVEGLDPFCWLDNGDSTATVTLDIDDYKQELFERMEAEGNGYDWELVAKAYLNQEMPQELEQISFDSESAMFCAYSSHKDTLKRFIMGFRQLCENDRKLTALMKKVDFSEME